MALLLDQGARVETRDNSGFTPLLAAAQRGHSSVCSLLLSQESQTEERTPAAHISHISPPCCHPGSPVNSLCPPVTWSRRGLTGPHGSHPATGCLC